jgi:hypothetical protein
VLNIKSLTPIFKFHSFMNIFDKSMTHIDSHGLIDF